MSAKNRLSIAVAGATALGICTNIVPGFEGKSNDTYLDPIGIPTICYGHTKGVRTGQSLTDDECDRLLLEDLGDALAVVDHRVRVPMTEARRAALASFVYNVGPSKFVDSTLLIYLNQGRTREACDQLLRWVYSEGHRFPGLVKRREIERELCLMGVAP